VRKGSAAFAVGSYIGFFSTIHLAVRRGFRKKNALCERKEK
jgi:hypothetical protein